MRHPLIRQGEGPAAAIERIQKERQAERDKLAMIAQDTAATDNDRKTIGTPAGDQRKLRGIPVQARGISGTVPGSNPLAALLANNKTTR